ncbi:MAG: hypothetical protein HUU56_04945 [Bdellovibrionaceae bacterium]|nr:hypothetical protein [Pseudobdellovibrionaceae bacterium]
MNLNKLTFTSLLLLTQLSYALRRTCWTFFSDRNFQFSIKSEESFTTNNNLL